MNELSFDKPYLANKGNTAKKLQGTGVPYSEEELLLNAYLASEPGATDAIELATRKGAERLVKILNNRKEGAIDVPGYKVVGFVPFNPVTKYTEATILDLSTGVKFKCIKGAPQVIISICGEHADASKAVLTLAQRGLRALGVARTIDDKMENFEMIGMISLLDPPRPDSAQTIKECIKLGVGVSFVTFFA